MRKITRRVNNTRKNPFPPPNPPLHQPEPIRHQRVEETEGVVGRSFTPGKSGRGLRTIVRGSRKIRDPVRRINNPAPVGTFAIAPVQPWDFTIVRAGRVGETERQNRQVDAGARVASAVHPCRRQRRLCQGPADAGEQISDDWGGRNSQPPPPHGTLRRGSSPRGQPRRNVIRAVSVSGCRNRRSPSAYADPNPASAANSNVT